MTAEQLSAAAGLVLSLVFSYVPGVNTWFANQNVTNKRLFMAFLLLGVAALSLGYTCYSAGQDILACVQATWPGYVNAVIAALVANQAAYLISPQKSKA